MNEKELLNRIKSSENLEKAFTYACNERSNDYFHDPLEITWSISNRERLLSQISEELSHPLQYKQDTSFAYFPPKSDITYRRMIFIPIRDLIIRYAFVNVIAEELDYRLHDKCFSNRKAEGKDVDRYLLRKYAETSWPNFVNWQEECSGRYTYMLKTDISSFYDSISHSYISKILAKALNISKDSEIIKFFRLILKVPVASYSHLDNTIVESDKLSQGLVIGCGTDGFLANIYLMGMDKKLNFEGIEYGRYTDDIRIFSNDRAALQKAIMVLQETLLALGLNLNASKTELASNPEQKEKFRSKMIDFYDYFDPEDDNFINLIAEQTDKHFSETDNFTQSTTVDKRNAKEFCKFLSADSSKKKAFDNLKNRKLWHIETLNTIIREFSGATKHASWLLIQSAFYNNIPSKVANRAIELIGELLCDSNVNSYARFRILFWLVTKKNKRNGNKLFIHSFLPHSEDEFVELCKVYLSEPAIELNLVAVLTLRTLGFSKENIELLAKKHCIKPMAEPIRNAISYISTPEVKSNLILVEDDFEHPANYQDYI